MDKICEQSIKMPTIKLGVYLPTSILNSQSILVKVKNMILHAQLCITVLIVNVRYGFTFFFFLSTSFQLK